MAEKSDTSWQRQIKMYIRFWGARGSISTPGKETFKYGGNTSCNKIRCGKEIFILDTGSGIRELGNKIYQSRKIIRNSRDK
ncbi:MAG: hypothetical protein ACYST3_01880 [Planctomycetota bacterium]